MKKIIRTSLSLFLFFVLIICGCQREPDVKIGLLMDDYRVERWQKDRDIFVSTAEELGAKVIDLSAGGDDNRQIELARELVEQGIQVLVLVAVNMETATEIIQIAHEKNVKVIAYDRLVRNSDLDFYISFDNIEVGKLQAEYLTSIKPEGNYVLIGGARTDNNAFLLHQGQMQVLAPLEEKGKITILHDEYVNVWDKNEAYRQMDSCLRKEDSIDVVLAANDDLATGIIKALKEHDLEGKVLVAGQDADMAACKRITKGSQAITVYKPIRNLATKAAEISVQLAKGEKLDNTGNFINNGKRKVPSILLDVTVVNQETIMNTVVADGHIEKNNIYKE